MHLASNRSISPDCLAVQLDTDIKRASFSVLLKLPEYDNMKSSLKLYAPYAASGYCIKLAASCYESDVSSKYSSNLFRDLCNVSLSSSSILGFDSMTAYLISSTLANPYMRTLLNFFFMII